MKEKEIEKTLKKYKQSYAPWELESGNCPMYYDSDLVEFGKEMYEKGIYHKTIF